MEGRPGKIWAKASTVLGRDPDLALCLGSPSVSRRHAQLRVTGGAAVLEDLGSKNGTFLNDRKVTSPVSLSDGDQLRLGTVRLTLRTLGSPASTQTAGSREE